MERAVPHLKRYLAAALLAAASIAPAGAQEGAPQMGGPAAEAPEGEVDALLAELAAPDLPEEAAARIEQRIAALWSRSGSASMDLLLRRGREALEGGDPAAALGHLTALTDHAPGFAEGWNARATAFYALDMPGEALDDLGRALTLEPRHFMALAGLGVLLEEMGFEREALEAYRMARDLHPHLEQVNDAVERLELATGGRAL